MTDEEKLLALVAQYPGKTPPELSALLGKKSNTGLGRAIYLGRLTRKRVKSERFPNVGSWAYYPK